MRCLIAVAKKWGLGGMYLVNLYPRVVDELSEVELEDDCVSAYNHRAIERKVIHSSYVVVCWGAAVAQLELGQDRVERVLEHFSSPLCFGYSPSGHPLSPHALLDRAPEEVCLVPFVPKTMT